MKKILLGLVILLLFCAPLFAGTVTKTVFDASYTTAGTTITFTTLIDNTTYVNAATSTSSYLYGFSGKTPKISTLGYAVRSNAFNSTFLLATRSKYNGDIKDGVWWYGTGVAGLPISIDWTSGPVIDIYFLTAKPMQIDITSDTYTGTLYFIPSSSADNHWQLHYPNWTITAIRTDYT